jgi:hypothetical protein
MARQRVTFWGACMEYLFGPTCCSRLDDAEPEQWQAALKYKI